MRPLYVAPFIAWGAHTALLAGAFATAGTALAPALLLLAAIADGAAALAAAAAAAARLQAAALLHAQAALARAEKAQEQGSRQGSGWPCSLFYLIGMADAFLLVAEALALRRPLRQATRLRTRAWALLQRTEEAAGGHRP